MFTYVVVKVQNTSYQFLNSILHLSSENLIYLVFLSEILTNEAVVFIEKFVKSLDKIIKAILVIVNFMSLHIFFSAFFITKHLNMKPRMKIFCKILFSFSIIWEQLIVIDTPNSRVTLVLAHKQFYKCAWIFLESSLKLLIQLFRRVYKSIGHVAYFINLK